MAKSNTEFREETKLYEMLYRNDGSHFLGYCIFSLGERTEILSSKYSGVVIFAQSLKLEFSLICLFVKTEFNKTESW